MHCMEQSSPEERGRAYRKPTLPFSTGELYPLDLFGARPLPSGETCRSYMAILSAPNHMALDRWQLMLNLPGRIVSIKTTRGNAEVKVTAFFSSPPIRYDYRDLLHQKRLTAEAFADAGWEIPRLLAAMHGAPDFYFDSTSQIRFNGIDHAKIVEHLQRSRL